MTTYRAMKRINRGFTLTELMVSVALVAVLASIATPSFTTFIEGQRVKGTASDLHTSLTRARSEAIKRGLSITLNPKAGNWASGWQIADPVSGEVIEDHAAISGLTLSGPASVTYRNSGRIAGNTDANFNIVGTDTTQARCIRLDLGGRPSVKASSC